MKATAAVLLLAAAVPSLAAPVAEVKPRVDYGSYVPYGTYGEYSDTSGSAYGSYGPYPKPGSGYGSYNYKRAVDWIKSFFS